MSIRLFCKLLFGGLIVLATVTGMFIAIARINRGILLQRLQNENLSYQLADELRQTSDDLTRFARTYVATGDPKYEQYYRDVLAIRNGAQPRPDHYERIYWDFFVDLGKPPRPASQAVSLLSLMKAAGFPDADIARLSQAQDRSNALVQIEETAMAAMKGRFRDASGNFTRTGPPDRALAIRLMNDDNYQHQKALIMQPIDDTIRAVEERTTVSVDEFNRASTLGFHVIEFVLGLFLLLVFISYPLVRRRILSPVTELQGQTQKVAVDLDRLADVTRKVAEGDLTQTYSVSAWPIQSTRQDEIGDLSRLHNAMIGKLEETGTAIAAMTAELNLAHEQRFKALFDNSLTGIYIIQDNTLCDVNPAMAEMFGFTPEEGIGTDPLNFVHPEDRAFVTERLRQRLSGEKESDRYEFRGRRKDGETIYVETLVKAFELNGRIAVIGNAADITERRNATLALQESEARFRTLLEMAPVAVAMSRGAITTYVNDRYLATFGYENSEELIGHPVSKTWVPAGKDVIEELSRRRGKGEFTITSYEETGIRKDGTHFRAQIEGRTVNLQDGPASLVFILDITDRKRAEEALRESEARFRTLFEMAPVGLCISRNAKAIDINQKTLEIFGYDSAEDIVGRPLGQLFAEETRTEVEERASLRPQGIATLNSYETIGLRRDSTPFPVQIEATVVNLPDGPATLGFALDITDRKREEATLLEKARLQEFLDGIVSTVPGAIYSFIRRPDGTSAIPYASARYKDLTGIDPAELKEDASAALAQIHPDDQAGVEESMARSSRELSEWRHEFRVDHPERGTLWIDGNSIPVRQPDGNVAWHGYLSDITHSKQLEMQVLQAQKMEAVGQLAGGVAHDFNNVIGAILGWADICIENASADEAQVKRLQRIKNQASLGANLTKQLLAFSRKQILQPENLSLNDVAQQVLPILESSLGSKIQVSSYFDPHLLEIRGDFTQMQQLAMNLCLNARDAMPDGGCLIVETRNMLIDEEYCRHNADAKPGSYVGIFVSDTGTGIDAKTLGRIFEPFFTTKGPGKGTGLGLSVVYGVVKQHGGFINAYSEVGVGTTFRVFLPALSTGEAHAPTLQAPVQGGTECILVADDHDDFRAAAIETLKGLGYEIIAAADGREAMACFEANADRIRLMVLDVMMPQMQGTEVFDEVRKVVPAIPAILVTGYSERILAGWMEGKQGVGILPKPYNSNALARLVRQALDRTEITERGTAAC